MATTTKLIAKATLGSAASTIDFDNIPGTYTDLLFTLSARSPDGTTNRRILGSFNNSSANFTLRLIYSEGVNVYSGTRDSYGDNQLGYIPGGTTAANTFGVFDLYIPNYTGSTNKSMSVTAVSEDNATTAFTTLTAGLWSQTAAITRVTFSVSNASTFATGTTAYLYGITKA
jgi:hypothetical protein